VEHLLFFCPFSASFWERLGVQVRSDATERDQLHRHRPETLSMAVLLATVEAAKWNRLPAGNHDSSTATCRMQNGSKTLGSTAAPEGYRRWRAMV